MKKICIFWIFFTFFVGLKDKISAQNNSQKIESFIETIEGVKFKMIKIPTKNYYMAETEVTQELYEAIMGKGNNPSLHKNCPQCPVEMVTWKITSGDFLRNLIRKTGKLYKLPTIEEWEFAAFGGETYKFAGSENLDEVAWYFRNSDNTTHPVKQKKPNGYGLYDVLGNIYEWCQDPLEKVAGKRCLKGGSFVFMGKKCYRIKQNICYGARPIEEDLDFPAQMYGMRLCLGN